LGIWENTGLKQKSDRRLPASAIGQSNKLPLPKLTSLVEPLLLGWLWCTNKIFW